MSAIFIEPDLDFIKGLKESGADTVKKCFQCATCSVVCNIAPEGGPFPRKEMVWAQWGLKDKIAADPDVWLCHNCGDCTTHCPRGAKPAEVLGVLRKATIEKYAMVKTFAKLSDNFLAMLILPTVIILAILAAVGHINILANYHGVTATGETGPIIFNNFFSTHYIDPLFTAAFLFAVASAAYGIYHFWNDICDGAGLGKFTGRNALGSILPTILQIVMHNVFGNCGVNKDRKIPHMLALFSFVALFITTNWAVFYLYVLGWEPGSYSSLANPLKWLGNIGAIMLIVGSLWLMKNRSAKADTQKSSSFDWNLLYLILLIGITGFVAQVLRIGGAYAPAQAVYVLHLIFVLSLFIFAPYSKLAHLLYRTTAMVFAVHTGRKLKLASDEVACATCETEAPAEGEAAEEAPAEAAAA